MLINQPEHSVILSKSLPTERHNISKQLDLKALGYKALKMPLEIGSRNSRNCKKPHCAGTCHTKHIKSLRKTLGKIALVASQKIYLARRSNEWSGG